MDKIVSVQLVSFAENRADSVKNALVGNTFG